MNYFELFNIEPKFEVDLTALASDYQKLQQLTHPDRFATASEKEKLLAVQKNAQVNDAYHVLKSPLSRAEHLLVLQGVELKHEQQTMQDTVFLMQQMEWREQLAEIKSTDEPLDALESLEEEIRLEIKQHLERLKDWLATDCSQAKQSATEEVRKLKFLYKLRHEIELLEESLDEF